MEGHLYVHKATCLCSQSSNRFDCVNHSQFRSTTLRSQRPSSDRSRVWSQGASRLSGHHYLILGATFTTTAISLRPTPYPSREPFPNDLWNGPLDSLLRVLPHFWLISDGHSTDRRRAPPLSPAPPSYDPATQAVGVGYTPEGLDQNPTYYELLQEAAFKAAPVRTFNLLSLSLTSAPCLCASLTTT